MKFANQIIVREGRRHSGMMDSNHLQSLLQEDPAVFSNVLTKVYASQSIQATPLLDLTEGRGKVKYIEDMEGGNGDSWTWKQEISPRPAVVLENLESENTTPGIDRTSFRIKLDQDWFRQGSVIAADPIYQVRVSDHVAPYKDGQGWVYTVELVTDDPNQFMPAALLAPGQEYIELYSIYGEKSSRANTVKFDGHIELMGYLSDMQRKEYEVTGYADDRVLVAQNWATDSKSGEPIKLVGEKWINRAEIKFWKDLMVEKENMLMWARGQNDIIGENGYKVRTPYGFDQICSWGHTESYSKFTAKLIREFLMDVFFGRNSFEKRNVVLMTGEYGMMLFDEAFKNETNGLFLNADKFTTGSGMNMGYGYQFTKAYFVNGINITLKHMPSLDVNITKAMRSNRTGYPRRSASFYIADLSGENRDNMWIIKHRSSMKYGYQIGTSAPWELKGGIISNTIDGYKLIARDRCGFFVQDPSRLAKLELKELV